MNDIYYEPKVSGKLHSKDLFDSDKYMELLNEIDNSRISDDEKQILKLCATRFIIPKYGKIADYYATASNNMKDWLERLHAVVVDYDSAVKQGYFTFCKKYEDMVKEIVSDDK